MVDRFYEFRPLARITQAVDGVEYNLQTDYEVLDDDFEVLPGVVIPQGAYQSHRWELQGETSDTRTLSLGIFLNRGGIYTGEKQTLSIFSTWKPTRNFSVSLDWTPHDL